jgi:para-aminobenzoate synthetase component I
VKEAVTFPVNDFESIKLKMLNWANQFSIFCLLDNNSYHFESPSFECLLAAGCIGSVKASAGNAFEQLNTFANDNKGQWLFGHLGYDLKNETEHLQSNNFDGIQFPDTHFFVPEFVLKLTKNKLSIYAGSAAEEIFNAVNATGVPTAPTACPQLIIQTRISKPDYIDTIKKLQAHMLRGDCYEVNFCQEFFAMDAIIDPLDVYKKLSAISPNPFAALYKMNDRYCICASPERYLKKSGSQLFSQPIKGTVRRNLSDGEADEINLQYLLNSNKEKSENVMVVDLVRNDLSRICKEGTVKVEELFGIYSFPQLHQMISTISGTIAAGISWVDAVKATFPMGSMTGAPKKRVMELIEAYEKTKRGVYSGAIGYVSPEGDFDFNVVIRSILYNSSDKYLSFQAGSAVTFYSDANNEYEECLLKAEAIKKSFSIPGNI